jgi:ketosteroid isomerase-like protein
MATAQSSTYDQPIRQLMNDWADALRGRNLDTLMSFYAPGAVFFDGIPPLRVDDETYRHNWSGFFEWFPGSPELETRDVKIAADESVAFASALTCLRGTKADGTKEGAWMRQSVGFEKVGGAWRITHEHWSLPMDMESGKAVTDLQPE